MTRQVAALPDATSPAIDAAITSWKALSGHGASISSASIVADGEKSLVVRLFLDCADGGPIIAKRAAGEVVLCEAYLYEHVLPAARVVTPRFLGVGPDRESSRAWLFLNDVGGVDYEPSNPTHAALLARWLASLHAATREAPPDALNRLPIHDDAAYLARLRQSRAMLQERLATMVDDGEAHAVLRRAAEICSELESSWPRIAELSRILPSTLVHGDLAPENVRISEGQVYVFDWEKAGRGVPVVDVIRIDIETYAPLAHELWGVSSEDVESAARCGAIFRTLSHRWAEKRLRDVDLYRHRLARELRATKLGGAAP